MGPAKGTKGATAKASLWGLSERRPRLGVATHSFSSAQHSAWGRGRRGNSCQGSSGPNPAQSAHRESVVYVEGNLPPLEGELLLPVPAHCHQSRHRSRRCRCHRHHLLPAAAAAAAAAAPAAAASSQLLPATAKPRERKHPPPRSTFATGERGGGARSKKDGRAALRFPSPDSTRAQPISAPQGRDPPPRAACPPPPTPPARPLASSQGPKERRKGPAGPGTSPPGSGVRAPGAHPRLGSTAHAWCPPLTPSPRSERPAQGGP